MKTEKEIIEEMLLEITNKLWLYESMLIRQESWEKENKNRKIDLSEDPEYTRIEGCYSACRDLLVRFKSKLGNSESSLFFNSLTIKKG